MATLVIGGGRLRRRLGLFIAAVIVVPTIVFALASVYSYPTMEMGAMSFISAAILVGVIWSFNAQPQSSTITAGDDGTVSLELAYFFNVLSWNGHRREIVGIDYVTYDTGEGVAKYVILKIRNVGSIWLREWSLKMATLFAKTIGLQVSVSKADLAPLWLSRKELIGLFTPQLTT